MSTGISSFVFTCEWTLKKDFLLMLEVSLIVVLVHKSIIDMRIEIKQLGKTTKKRNKKALKHIK